MKKCPFCAEDIQDAAIKCKHCGEFLSRPAAASAAPAPAAVPGMKWYYKNTSLAVLFLCVGPLMLPLVWLHPRYSRIVKIVLTAVILVLTYYLTIVFANSMKSIMSYYQELQSAVADIS